MKVYFEMSKTLIYTAVLIICLTSIGLVNAQKTATLSVEPTSYEIDFSEVGETFAVNITVNDVERLWGWAVRINWDPLVLNFTKAVEGDFLKSAGETLFMMNPNRTALEEGNLQELTCDLLSMNDVNGSGILAYITFEVVGAGNSQIILDQTHLWEHAVDSQDWNASLPEINHSIVNGEVTAFTSNPTLPDLTLILIAGLIVVALVVPLVAVKKKSNFTKKIRVRQIAIWAILTAVCVAVQLTPRPPNVEFTSLICFLSGFLFGGVFGAAVGFLTMIVNGFLSPWGYGGIIIPFQIIGMALMGIVGGLYRKYSGDLRPSVKTFSLEVAMLAVLLTGAYDVITNYGFAIMFEINFILALIQGIWFAIVHTVSNTVLFSVALYPLINIISKVLGEKLWQFKQKPLS
jgi:hypothetical protein